MLLGPLVGQGGLRDDAVGNVVDGALEGPLDGLPGQRAEQIDEERHLRPVRAATGNDLRRRRPKRTAIRCSGEGLAAVHPRGGRCLQPGLGHVEMDINGRRWQRPPSSGKMQ